MSHEFEPVSAQLIGAALAVHRALGPGFRESFYKKAMCVALTNRQIAFATEVPVTVEFEGIVVGRYRLDLVVEDIVVELKAVREILDVHKHQVLSYLKASRLNTGLLLNFNASQLFIKRIVN
jgi:GxxExxY protein